MTFSELFIRRPVLTTLLTVSFIVVGVFAYRLLPISALPRVDYPTIQIIANLPGASPEIMAATVASPIEEQLSTIAGITSMTSTSSQGRSSITVEFDLNRSIDAASLDVQTALTTVQRRLPAEMTTPPSFRKVNPGKSPVLRLYASSATLPLSTIHDYAETVLVRQISQIPGVAQVVVYGGQKRAMRVQVDPAAAAARGVSLDEVRSVIVKANSSAPVGTLAGPRQNLTLEATGQLEHAADYRNVVVAWRNGAPVKLGEIARIADSVEDNKSAAFYNDERYIGVAISRQPDANMVEVVDSVLAMLPSLRAQIPPAIHVAARGDRSIPIREAVFDVQHTLVIALGLVILVIFLFLRSASATGIAALALPISLVGTCAAMYAFGFSINNITLLALTLSVGFVVDDAIVMLENIMRHVENGMRPFEAALKGAREIGFTIISITVSLIAVFIPVLFMGGVVGRVFREFAVTMTVAIVISAFVSLTLTPMLCARLRHTHKEGGRPNVVFRLFEAMFQSWLRAYEWTLDRVIRFKAVTLAITLLTIAGTVWAYIAIPKGFLPAEDIGHLWQETRGPADASFEAMLERQRQVAAIVRADPAVDSVSWFDGNWRGSSNYWFMPIQLKPRKERDAAPVVIKRLREALAVVPGVKIDLRAQRSIEISTGSSKYAYALKSGSTDDLYRIVPQMLDKLAKLEALRDVTSNLEVKPQMKAEIDREKAAIYGINMDQIRQELFNAYGSRPISTIYTPSNSYQVILETLPELQSNTTDLSRLRLKTGSGQTVPLEAVASLVPTVGLLQVHHLGQRPAVTISFDLAPGYSLGQALDAIQKIERESLPVTVSSSFQGAAQVFQDSLKGMPLLILAAIFATYVVLGILYESFVHPITIISGLPSAGIGALITLMAFNMEFTVIASIGMIMLIGIVKKNAIMMVDFAIERRRAGLSAHDAIREACLLRFRPIMMTTFAAIFGALPIAIGAGAGAEFRQPLGVAVVGGLVLSQLLTLYITPVVYLYLDRLDRKVTRQLEPPREEVPETERPRPVAVAAE